MTVLDVELSYDNINPETGSVLVCGDMTPEQDPVANTWRPCYTCGAEFKYDKDHEGMMHVITYTIRNRSRDMMQVHNYICPECTVGCSDCGNVMPRGDHSGFWFLLNDRYLDDMCSNCASDYNECERCESVVSSYDTQWVGSDSTYCDSCITRVAAWCDGCDRWEWNDDMCSPHDDNIHNYGYKPRPIFYGTDPDNEHLRFGIELEVEAKNATLSDGSDLMTQEWDEFAYLKEDGSLNFGFEIVTHPASLKYYQDAVNWNTINKLRELGFRSWNTGTCGLHVHIDRRAFRNRSHIMAMSMLINNNRSLTEHIAGRNSDYGKIGEVAKHDNIRTLKRGYGGSGTGGDRYLAINLQNTNTIELRMFKGSLKVERILSAIEFTHAVVTYSRDIQSGTHAGVMLRPEEFTSWVRKQGKYPNLVQFLPDFTITTNNNEMETEE